MRKRILVAASGTVCLASLIALVVWAQRDRTPATTQAPNGEPHTPPVIEPPSIHSEQGRWGTIRIEEVKRNWTLGDARAGGFDSRVMLVDGIRWGEQVRTHNRHLLDHFQLLTVTHPLDNATVLGAVQAFDLRMEPLTYYHRRGPVGALFAELATRNQERDSNAPIAKFGLETGAVLCYARPGQSFTVYESDPIIKKLAADTDEYFTHFRDARNRGAKVEIRLGDRRQQFKADVASKYALVLVEAYEGRSLCTDLLTKEAIALYFDRLKENGLVAIHVSSRDVNLEPMLARVADELNLTGRIWTDGEARLAGKCSSSWLVLAKSQQALGLLGEQTGYGAYLRPIKTQDGVPAWSDTNTEIVTGMRRPSAVSEDNPPKGVVMEVTKENVYKMQQDVFFDDTKRLSDSTKIIKRLEIATKDSPLIEVKWKSKTKKE